MLAINHNSPQDQPTTIPLFKIVPSSASAAGTPPVRSGSDLPASSTDNFTQTVTATQCSGRCGNTRRSIAATTAPGPDRPTAMNTVSAYLRGTWWFILPSTMTFISTTCQSRVWGCTWTWATKKDSNVFASASPPGLNRFLVRSRHEGWCHHVQSMVWSFTTHYTTQKRRGENTKLLPTMPFQATRKKGDENHSALKSLVDTTKQITLNSAQRDRRSESHIRILLQDVAPEPYHLCANSKLSYPCYNTEVDDTLYVSMSAVRSHESTFSRD